jgi:hypothetical protein
MSRRLRETNAISEDATYEGLIFGGWMPMGWTSAIAISDNPTYAAWT